MGEFVPQRVVSLQPSATVTLADLGLLDRVVACTRWCMDVVPQAAGRIVLKDSWSADATEIVAARPDLVIASVPYREKALAEILKSGGRFLGLAPKTLADVYGDIVTIARVMGVEERGEDVVARMRVVIDEMRAQSSRLSRVRVFCEEWGKPIIRSQPWVAELVEAAGGEFIGEPGKQTEAKAVRAAEPEVIIAAWCGVGDRVPLARVVAERGWQEMSAVRSGRVYCIPDEYLNTPASTLLDGLRCLAHAIHPERFPLPARMRRIAVAVEAL
jgi:iron complex transport system substrate-binding protein